MEAIIQQGKSQFTVKQDSVIRVDKLDLEPNSQFEIQKVLLVKNSEMTLFGKPYLESKVLATVIAHGKADKVINFKCQSNGYHRKMGHRQQYTEIKIDKIES